MNNREDALGRSIGLALTAAGALMVLYHLVATQIVFQGAVEHRDTHLGFALVVVFLALAWAAKRRVPRLLALGFALAGLVATAYIRINFNRLEMMRGFVLGQDLVIGVILLLVVLEATRRHYGLVIPLLTLASIAYFLWGHRIPGHLGHPYIPPTQVIATLAVGLDAGVLGPYVSMSANLIFLFMVFGALMGVTGATRFATEAGKYLGRLVAGGAAQTAVVSSALIGMVNGSAMANVVIAGSYTIPMMKKQGFPPALAGGIEATASTGGQLMPPVMGAAAFIMAVFAGVPYVEVCKAAIIPSIFYYLVVAFQVRGVAKRLRILPGTEPIDNRALLAGLPPFVIPLGLIFFLLLQRYSVMFTGFWSIVCLVVVSLIRKETRPSPAALLRGTVDGALQGASIAIVCACTNAMVEGILVTGIGDKLVAVVANWSRGSLFLALPLSSILLIFLGCGMPTVAAYVLGATLLVPMMERLGISNFSAHMFVMYYAVVSAVTPPVATAAISAAPIAGAHYLRIGVEATKLSTGILVLPYLFVLNPVLLGRGLESSLTVSLTLITTALGMFCLASAITGVAIEKMTPAERALCVLDCFVLLAYVLNGVSVFAYAGIVLFAGLILAQVLLVRSRQKARAMSFPRE